MSNEILSNKDLEAIAEMLPEIMRELRISKREFKNFEHVLLNAIAIQHQFGEHIEDEILHLSKMQCLMFQLYCSIL